MFCQIFLESFEIIELHISCSNGLYNFLNESYYISVHLYKTKLNGLIYTVLPISHVFYFPITELLPRTVMQRLTRRMVLRRLIGGLANLSGWWGMPKPKSIPNMPQEKGTAMMVSIRSVEGLINCKSYTIYFLIKGSKLVWVLCNEYLLCNLIKCCIHKL